MTVDLSSLAFEPMITKHRAHYDSPWKWMEPNKDTTGRTKPRKVLVIDIKNNTKTIIKSITQTSRLLNSDNTMIIEHINNGKIYRDRYFFEEVI